MRTLLTAGTLVLPDTVLADPWLLIEDGTIHSFGTRRDGLPQHQEHHDLPGGLLAPAMLDIHVHGAAGHDVMEGTPDGVAHVSNLLAKHGVGAWLPTLVTAAVDRTLFALDGLATLIEKQTLPRCRASRRPFGRTFSLLRQARRASARVSAGAIRRAF